MCLKKVARLPLNSTHKQSLDVFFVQPDERVLTQ
jgi:hypothetical protein